MLILSATLDTAANYFYFRAFEVGEASIASAVLATSPLFTLLLSPFLTMTQHLTWRQGWGALTSIAGIVLLNRQLAAPRAASHASTSPRQIGLALLAAALLGSNIYLAQWLFIQHHVTPYSYYLLRCGIIAALSGLILRPNWRWITPRALQIIAGRAILVIIQWLALLYGVQYGAPALVKTLSDSSPFFIVFLAPLWLPEKITWGKLLGVMLIIGGLWQITV